MPPWTGRPYVYCSERCRAEAAAAREAERERWYRAEREKERAREAAEKRRGNLRAGGVRRLEQLQADAWDARPTRCGWFEPGDDHVCQRRVTRSHLVWCREHTDREEKLEEEAAEAEEAEVEEAAAAERANAPEDFRMILPRGPSDAQP
jgi:hypothetical protein